MRFRTLRARLLVFFTAFLLVVQVGVFFLTNNAIVENARSQVRSELAIGKRILGRLLQQNTARLEDIASVLAADAAFQTADQAVQTHGGFGYAREYHVERYWRGARLMRIAPISQEMIMNYVSEHVLELPRSY